MPFVKLGIDHLLCRVMSKICVYMEHLILNAFQEIPTFAQAQAMCQQVSLETRTLVDPRLDTVLNQIRETHVNGGALFASFNVGPSKAG
jgi:hypothetical protein